jgi:L-threonylcarbamoyladenylate synthase
MNQDISKALEVLKKGGVILYPTDTIWGIGCDASNVDAVRRVYEIKKREDSKSMIVLLDNLSYLSFYINEVPEIAYELIDVSDKPLTIIYPGAKNLATNLIASDGSIGIRIPNDDFCKQLISKLRKPLVSTSANISGKSSPSNFNEIAQEIIEVVDYVVEWRQNDYSKSQPSSIIKLGVKGQIEIIRK